MGRFKAVLRVTEIGKGALEGRLAALNSGKNGGWQASGVDKT